MSEPERLINLILEIPVVAEAQPPWQWSADPEDDGLYVPDPEEVNE
jgi:hypothetical protein